MLSYVLVGLQIANFIFLTIPIVWLSILLRKQQKLFTGDQEIFKKERLVLITILFIFDSSYIVRAVIDELLVVIENFILRRE